MKFFDSISSLFKGSDHPDNHGKSLPKPQGTARLPHMPTTLNQKAKIAWWQKTPGESMDTFYFTQEQTAIAKKVSLLVNTRNFTKLKVPKSIHDLFALLAKKEITQQDLAPIAQAAPGLMTDALPLLGIEGLEKAPRTTGDWAEALHRGEDWDRVVRVIFATTARKIFLSGKAGELPEAKELWDHSYSTAIAVLHLCKSFRFKRVNLAFATALLHDIGRLAVLWSALEVSRDITGQIDVSLVRHLCKSLHEEAGGHMAELWGLPTTVSHIIGNHHGRLHGDDRLAGLRALVQLADQSSLRCGHGALEAPSPSPLIECPSAKFLGLTEENAEKVLAPLPVLIIEATI